MKPKAATKRAAMRPEPYSFPTTIAATAALDLVALAEAEVPEAVPDPAPADDGPAVALAPVCAAVEVEAVAVKLRMLRVPHWSRIFVMQLSWPAWSFWWAAIQRAKDFSQM